MESKSYAISLGKLADALKRWADDLSYLNPTKPGVQFEFSEPVRAARIKLVAKLVVGGHGDLVQLIDDSLKSLFYKGLHLSHHCNELKPPRGVKSWDDVPLADKCCRKDLPETLTLRANSLRCELCVCDELFAAISGEIRQSESTNSDEQQPGRIQGNESPSLESADKMLSKPTAADRSTQAVDAARPVSSTILQIPREHRTRTVTKSEAAKLHAGRKVANPTSYLNYLINDGRITAPMGSGQKWVFDIRDFPANKHDKLR